MKYKRFLYIFCCIPIFFACDHRNLAVENNVIKSQARTLQKQQPDQKHKSDKERFIRIINQNNTNSNTHEGGYFQVENSDPFTFNSIDWITPDADKKQFTIHENTSATDREATIIFTSIENPSITESIYIKQTALVPRYHNQNSDLLEVKFIDGIGTPALDLVDNKYKTLLQWNHKEGNSKWYDTKKRKSTKKRQFKMLGYGSEQSTKLVKWKKIGKIRISR